MKRFSSIALVFAVLLPAAVPGNAASRKSYPTYNYSSTARTPTGHPAGDTASKQTASAVSAVPYNSGWEDKSRSAARREFQRRSGFRNGRVGYVVDYIVPLSRGGSNSPDNMRWVRVEDALNGAR